MTAAGPEWLAARADDDFCYLTTYGRVTGRAHTVEIWFGVYGRAAYLLAGGGRRSDFVRNLIADHDVRLRIGDETRVAKAMVVTDPTEDALARRLLAGKYQGWTAGEELSGWARSALPVAVEPADE